MANLPANRTKLQAAISNQQPSIIASSQANREALVEIYDTADLLYQNFVSAVLSGSLTLIRTTADIAYYVNAVTGNDANDGLSIGNPLKTMQAAVNKIPQIVNHVITINVAAGTYAENFSLPGFNGSGTIQINGGSTLVAAANYLLQKFVVSKCTCYIQITGFTTSAAADDGYWISGCTNVRLSFVRSVSAAASFAGVRSLTSNVLVENSEFSNRIFGILSQDLARVRSLNNGGTGNQWGIRAVSGSDIRKEGTQPAGTTAEGAVGGGQIL